MIALLCGLALAGGEAPDVQDAWHHFDRKRYAEAVALSVSLLEADASNLEAHRVYVWASQRNDWYSSERIESVYRSWHEENPDDAVARFAWLAALHKRSSGEECDTAMPLLDPLPDGPARQYSALRIKDVWMQSCDKAGADAVEEAIASLPLEAGAAASSWRVFRLAQQDRWDEVVAAIPDVSRSYPQRLRGIARLAFDEKSAELRPVQRALLDFAGGWQAESDVVRLHAEHAVLRSAKHKDSEAALERLDELDPPGESGDNLASELMMSVYEANQRPTHESALASLDKLGKKLPESGDERKVWYRLRLERLEALEQADDAYVALGELVRLDPENGGRVNEWAYESVTRGESLEEALAAIEHVLPQLDETRYEGDWGYEAWVADTQSTRAAWEDTRGWLLYELGRHEEAVEVLVRASRSARDATISAHTGLALRAVGDDEAAWPYLVDAHVSGGTSEPDLDALAKGALSELWPEHAEWHPGGLDGWIEGQRAAEQEAEQEAEVADEDGPGEDHPLLGEAFPYKTADRLGGGTIDLEGSEGILVVDFWATWCGPCVQGMPHLQEVAAEYGDRGVRVVGLSVDGNVGAVKKFFKGVDSEVIAYELGHVGKEGMETMQVSGIPALFVVDGEDNVRHYISGYGKGDGRLEVALDTMVDK